METTNEVQAAQAVTTQENTWVEIARITVPEDARKHTPEDIDSRAISLAKDGQLENILLSKEGDQLVLVYGNGRLESAKKAGWEKIRADIKEGLTESQKLLMTLAENEERENAGPFYTASLYQRLMETEHLTQEQLADKLGKTKVLIEKYATLMKVSAEARQNHNALWLSLRQCLAIAKLTNPEDQLKVMEECATQDLSGKALDARVKQLLNPAKVGDEAQAKPAAEVKPYQFSWKNGGLVIKAFYKPEDGNFIQFTCDMDHAYSAFVNLHPQPVQKEASIDKAA